MMPPNRSDFIVVGSGIAGLATALRAAKQGSVLLITKGSLLESNTFFAQGGIAAALAPGDTPQAHSIDTMVAGAEMCEPDAVTVLVHDGPTRINDLIELGTKFDKTPSGELAFGKEGAHSVARILHARGDATGAEIATVLAHNVKANPNIIVAEHTLLIDLLVSDNRCVGCWVLVPNLGIVPVTARATVLATGGSGQVYRHTTNPWVATGDGPAAAFRAGAMLIDMEFVQFHPTALARPENPMFLISEAVRGEGAILVNDKLQRFMPAIHPQAELAPRDVVARAIFDQMHHGHTVYLDATGIGERFMTRFPTITQACLERGINPVTDPIPVTPAAHFIMGGIETNTLGQSSLAGLYACGEAACTGVHGANRLASNSLLEGLVFSERIVHALASEPALPPVTALPPPPTAHLISLPEQEDRVRSIMWDHAGLVRTASGLQTALDELDQVANQILPGAYTLRNLVDTARLIAAGALLRTESRGGHYRRDFPTPDSDWRQRRLGQRSGTAPEIRVRGMQQMI